MEVAEIDSGSPLTSYVVSPRSLQNWGLEIDVLWFATSKLITSSVLLSITIENAFER